MRLAKVLAILHKPLGVQGVVNLDVGALWLWPRRCRVVKWAAKLCDVSARPAMVGAPTRLDHSHGPDAPLVLQGFTVLASTPVNGIIAAQSEKCPRTTALNSIGWF